MKPNSIVFLAERHEVHDFVMRMWKTEFFRGLHYRGIATGGPGPNFVSKIVERFADLPRFFFTMSDTIREKAHFSTWWGGIPARTYDNPYIHDLYLIHEMSHGGEMVYMEGMNFENFLRKMTDNELHASVVSEIQIYLELPQLRKLSFKHPIYADSFLKDKAFMARYRENPTLTFEELKTRRRNTMMDSTSTDFSERWIHRFSQQNAAWGAVWAHRYNLIEAAMVKLRDTPKRDVALKRHVKWLIANSQEEIPFLREAKAFSGIYWGNLANYEEEKHLTTKKI